MTPEQRILRIILLERMKKDKDYAKRLGLTDISTFIGKRIHQRALSLMFVIFVYFMMLMTTDNVSIYILFLVPMYSICLALIREKTAGS